MPANIPQTGPGGSNSLASRVISTYTTFSGIDITAIFDNLVLATLSGIATSLTREKVPVFTFGSANARSISRGKRACAGSMQFTLFDRDAFYGLYLDESHYYYAHSNEINWLTNPVNVADFTGLFYDPGIFQERTGGGGDQLGVGILEGQAPAVGVREDQAQAGAIAGAQATRRAAQHADQVYPFDVTLVAQNEYGRAASCAVIGVEVINEGGGMSVDDITNEQQMTYIAITKLPWIPLTTGQEPEEGAAPCPWNVG